MIRKRGKGRRWMKRKRVDIEEIARRKIWSRMKIIRTWR